ncbi:MULTISPECIES: ZIP family metal transporter [Nocardia]|jgi:zinc transporter ZupT|uniref:Zinc transporter ZupT n=1 Tax=Nocardia ignorata TaxID=145285 RepID=A0A4R6PKA6_NOCIG|nr:MULTISPECIES: metal transporter [Nocardia]MBC7299724.1 ZIP family metal transporter [Nocardia sp.]TDP38587.1 zinc transporter ZupT [Nocardia ignorata]
MSTPDTRKPAWALGLGTGLLLILALAGLAFVGGRSLPERTGPPIEEIGVERVVLQPGSIELGIRNTGADPIRIGQVFVNDAYVDFTGPVEEIGRLRSAQFRLDYPWQDGQPYKISMLTSTGLVIEHDIAAAVQTPQAGASFFGLMALLGTYVGIIPVVLGMLFLPFLRTVGGATVRVLLAFTVGLLAFLAWEGTSEGFELAGASGSPFGGAELVVLGAALAFLTLTAIDHWLRTRRQQAAASGQASGLRLALMISIGIGLHNLGEGLAIGSAYAVGELALGAFLVIGFTIQNTTEGLAVVAPLTERRPPLLRLLGLGLIAGAPAIVGAVIGAGANNPELSALLLGIGVGAIVQVIVQIAPSLREPGTTSVRARTLAGIGVGMLTMYATGLLVAG